MTIDRKIINIGTRESALAMQQTNYVADALQKAHPENSFQIKSMKTKGDKILDAPLAKIGDKGLFTKELETALLAGQIDLAVHSMKDLPTKLPDGLAIGAVCKRIYPGDVLISQNNISLADLRPGARIGTGSLRRCAQLLRYRPDLTPINIRGNLPTRLGKLKELELDAIVLAYAGIKRLGYEELITQYIPFEICLPAVGQGSVGIEYATCNTDILTMLAPLNDKPAHIAIEAERALLQNLEGGCQTPIGAHGVLQDDVLTLTGEVLSMHGETSLRAVLTGPADKPEMLGAELANELLNKGAGELLQLTRQEFEHLEK